ncbi:hypothetical protein VI08_01790 [Luteibacter yeojuensis]|uniref:Uncharacterized protein n=1 Tax=Luteibacter yeojuensis TaxID=345309 RepID=A0A0F3L0E9_9GAMM|nr:hypothetical protein VI08_01790 [Luteibacter yeojuensis]
MALLSFCIQPGVLPDERLWVELALFDVVAVDLGTRFEAERRIATALARLPHRNLAHAHWVFGPEGQRLRPDAESGHHAFRCHAFDVFFPRRLGHDAGLADGLTELVTRWRLRGQPGYLVGGRALTWASEASRG